jgi:Tat protein secretion system quality control protein TatD with DNase activity
MPEITLSAIEQLLDKQLKPIKTVMASLATSQELTEIKTTQAGVAATVGVHTTLLDGIAKDVKTLLDEKTIAAARLARLEKWAQQAGEKIGIKLDLQTLIP